MVDLALAVLTVLVGSAMCSGTEAALFSVSDLRARQLAESGRAGGAQLLAIRQSIGRPIATVVVLNNVFNIVGSLVIGVLAARLLGDAWLGVFSGFLTLAVIVLGEIVPKTLGERYAESIALAVARPLALLTWLLTPLVAVIEVVASPVTKGRRNPSVTRDEIAILARIGTQEGIVLEEESKMVARILALDEVTAQDIMTPRVSMTFVRGDATLEAARELATNSQHSRIVVVGDSTDDVQGVVLRTRILVELLEGRGDALVRELARPVDFVPKNKRADELLRSFLAARDHLKVVGDEYGGVLGVVTLEDVLEVFTGEIVDETDRVADLQELARARRRRTEPA